VLRGEKTATAGLGRGRGPAAAGDRSRCSASTTSRSRVVEVTEARSSRAGDRPAVRRDEGEGFESVEDWRVAHERFFERPIRPTR
jgi:uncharacterized protein YhfF